MLNKGSCHNFIDALCVLDNLKELQREQEPRPQAGRRKRRQQVHSDAYDPNIRTIARRSIPIPELGQERTSILPMLQETGILEITLNSK